MRTNVLHYIKSRPELIQFVRQNPIWYRKLSRNPELIDTIEKEAKYFYGKTFSQKVNKFQQNIQMASFLLGFLQQMGQQEEG
jgi:hypothetical protein